MLKKLSGLVCLAVLAIFPANAYAQAYDSCDCVTPQSDQTTAGILSSAQGQVLVNGAPASDGTSIAIGSEILTGDGSANVTIGVSCNQIVGPNTQVLISQPGGAGANLCVKEASNASAISEPTVSNDVLLGGLLIGGGAAGIIALADDDDGGGRNGASN